MDNLTNNFSMTTATEMVLKCKDDVAKGVIALGSWIRMVKDNIPPKEYLDWLKYEVKIHPSTAWRFMKIARDIDYTTLERLGYSKIWEIMSLPESDLKKELIEKGEVMTKYEIREKIKASRQPPKEVPVIEEAEVELPNTAEVALKQNAIFLESLDLVEVDKIPPMFIGLLQGQLQETHKTVSNFLTKLHGRQEGALQ